MKSLNFYVKNLIRKIFAITLLSTIAHVASSDESPSSVESIETVEWLVSDEQTPPADSYAWKTLYLFGATRTGKGYGDEQIWFRFRLQRPEDWEQVHALYFWRYNMNISVHLNGYKLGGDTFRPGFFTQAWNHSTLMPIQPGGWRAGQNIVHVRFSPSPLGGTFAPVKFGLLSELEPIQKKMYWWKVEVNEYLLVFGCLILLCVVIFWANRPHDRLYLWFLGVTAAWCVVLSHMVIYYNPIPYDWWLRFVHMAVDTWIFCLFCFVHRLLNLSAPRAEKVMFACWCVAILSHILTPITVFWATAYTLHMVLTLGLLFLFLRVFHRAVVNRDRLAISVVLAVAGQVLLSAHDLWLFFAAGGDALEDATHYSQFGVPLILSVLLFHLLKRFTQALDESEKLNRELEDRAEATKLALELSFDENREVELAQAAVDERQKIYRDLHDDVGSKLLSIIHQGESDESSSGLASSALESLREAIYRANYDDEQLLDLLRLMREEAKLRMSAARIKLVWFEDPDLKNELLDAGQCYQLSRIFREIFSNAINHSGCSRVDVLVEPNTDKTGWLRFVVQDDGNGALVREALGSSGLRNIQFRSNALEGQSDWLAESGKGTTFVLVFEPITSKQSKFQASKRTAAT